MLNMFAYSLSSAQSNGKDVRFLEAFEWQHRLILINTQGECSQTLEQLTNAKAAIDERHILWFILCGTEIKSNYSGSIAPTLFNHLKKQYFANKKYSVLLIGKDGDEKYRSNELSLNQVFQRIDAMPMRQTEMRQQRKSNSE